jgi:hypothetical protein
MIIHKTHYQKTNEHCFCSGYNIDKQAASFNSYLSAIKYRLNLYNYFFRNLQMKSLIVGCNWFNAMK